MTFYCGFVDDCAWAVLLGEVPEAEIDAFVAHIGEVGQIDSPQRVVLDIAHDISLPTPLQRKKIASAVEGALAAKRLVAGHALATNSVAARGVLTAINWFVPKSFPEKVFSDPRAALEWLRTLNGAVDPTSVLAQIANDVPHFRTLRW